MDLEFSEEQEMLREMVRSMCSEYASIEVVRAMEDDPKGYSADFWKQLAELDLIGLTLPEAYGGSEQSMLEAAIVYEEFGRALAPSPHFASVVVCAGAILRAGSEEQKQTWLPQLASGDAIVVPAWLEPGNGDGPKGVQLRATVEGDDYVLRGAKLHVPYASSATRLLVPVRVGDGDEEIDLLLLDPSAAGVSLEQQMTISSDTQYKVVLDGARVAAADRIGEPGSGWKVWDAVMHEAIILAAAQAIGGARRALEMTVDYAKEREQFDKPLAAFQAISHYLADAATAVEGGATLVYEAAWAQANGKSIARLAPMAKWFACRTFRDVTATGQQVFGGVGFTLEYDIQLYFRRAKQLQLSWYETRHLEELIASDVLDS
jgi:alkylation response protein AidB-like acyl-CoA dehydrogenase